VETDDDLDAILQISAFGRDLTYNRGGRERL
jgi:hypothetical protein